jgi:hypothetical protein
MFVNEHGSDAGPFQARVVAWRHLAREHSMRGVWVAVIAGWVCATSLTAPVQASVPDPMAYAQQLVTASDPGARPFAIVDKRAARLIVFHADGTVAGATPALLGRSPGDHSVPGVGERTQAGRLRPGDRTTPAGRFDSQPGRNLQGDPVVWIDHDAALSIHRIRPGRAQRERERRLATATASDNRASDGCVVVSSAFFDTVVQPVLGVGRGVVYILPEAEPESAL